MIGIEEVLSVTNRELFFYAKDEYEEVSVNDVQHSFLPESFGRNSSATIALATHYAHESYGYDCMLPVLPADHQSDDLNAFVSAVKRAVAFADWGKLVTFGVKPDSPKAGYGYIEVDGYHVKRFIEKPDIKTARKYLSSGNYYWNSGMFCMSIKTIFEEIQNLCSDIISGTFSSLKFADYSEGKNWNQIEINAQRFENVRNISINDTVFEKSKKIVIVPCDMGWSDVGS